MSEYAFVKEGDKIIVTNYHVVDYPCIHIMKANGEYHYHNICVYYDNDNKLTILLDHRYSNCSAVCYIGETTTRNKELSLLANELLDINKNEIDQESAIRIFDELMKYSEEFNRIYDEAMDSYMMNTEMFRLHPNRKSAKISND